MIHFTKNSVRSKILLEEIRNSPCPLGKGESPELYFKHSSVTQKSFLQFIVEN